MEAECDAIPGGEERRGFVRGCLTALLVIALETRLRAWIAEPKLLGLALAGGLLLALADRSNGTRAILWIVLLAASASFAWWRPVAAWRWGFLLAIGVPLLSMIGAPGGPYRFDPGDVWYGLPPAIVVAILVARARRAIG
jgi:hypothetical protein